MTRHPRSLRLAGLATAAVALLAACSSGSTSSGAATTSAESSGASSSAGSSAAGSPSAGSAAASSPATSASELVGTGTGGIVVYNAQHENLTQAWADEFTKETGIAVEMRNGSDNELANQIVAEGSG